MPGYMIKFGDQQYPSDTKMSDFAKRLEVAHGFRLNAGQLTRVLHGQELTAQELVDLCS